MPFRLEIVTRGEAPVASFFNGDRRISSTGSRGTRAPYPFTATRTPASPRAAASSTSSSSAPSITGTWIVQAKSSKGETAWRFIARQNGGGVAATILRVDGDTGTLSGGYRDGRFVLSHFSGARPLLLEVTPRPDGTLTLRAERQDRARRGRAPTRRARAAIGTPTDPGAAHDA